MSGQRRNPKVGGGEPPPPYACRYCMDGYVSAPTMCLDAGEVVTVMAPRRCRACKGSGRTSVPPDTPPA